MMLYPSMSQLLEKVNSRYMLVNVAARRARNISDNAEQTGYVLEKKPVSYAIEEIAKGELTIDIGNSA
ncbi:MAG: DNA-directed RNA polymerase subunit omega [Oscillospiraceae bacterium]|nr:DNA-directed RNA polymerase subunit omega [Oscillospiraceae bacterium]